MKIINPNAPGRFQGAVEWFRINTPEDRFNLIGEPGEMLVCESNSQQWKWDTASASWIPATGSVGPDGSTSFAGPVRAPNTPAYPVVTAPRTVTQRLRGDGVRVALHGSSTLANGSSYRLLGGAAGDRKLCNCSLIWGLIAEGAEIDEVWNGAFAGDKTNSIATKFEADWPTIKDAFDVEFFAPAFNNLTDSADTLAGSKPLILKMLRTLVRYGKRIVWIMPFAGTPLSAVGVTHAKYQAYREWMYATIEAEQGYRGQILPWDLYSIFNPTGQDIDIGFTDGAITSQGFNQHMNNTGIMHACRHALSHDLIQYLQIPRVEGQDVYGTPVHALDMTTATASGCTVTNAGLDPDTGEQMYNITSAATLSYATSAALTVDPAKVYRFVGEYEVVTLKTADGNDFADGVKWEDPIAQRVGIWPWINGNSTVFSRRVLGRVKVFGPKWAPSDTSGAVRLLPGPPGAVIRVRGATPIRLYEVPA